MRQSRESVMMSIRISFLAMLKLKQKGDASKLSDSIASFLRFVGVLILEYLSYKTQNRKRKVEAT